MARTTTKKEDSAKKAAAPKADVTAIARYVHISAQKTRLVADMIRGKSAAESVVLLQNLKKRAAKPVLKLLLSAVANAEHNNNFKRNQLKISKITVDQGPAIKRWKPRAYGRAGEIRKPTSHISLTLAEFEGKAKFEFPVIGRRTPSKKTAAKAEKEKTEQPKAVPAKAKDAKEEKATKSKSAPKKGIFNRKAGER